MGCAKRGPSCAECPYKLHKPQSEDGVTAWAVFERCSGQIRTAALPNRVLFFGLDYGSILALADAMGARSRLLVECLPTVESIVLAAFRAGVEDAERIDPPGG